MVLVRDLTVEKKQWGSVGQLGRKQTFEKHSFSHQHVRRFQSLYWPLNILETYGELTKDGSPLKHRTISTRYPLWALRYWWAACAILEEYNRCERSLVVVDLGCERGIVKRFVPIQDGIRWIGLDRNVSNPLLIKASYQETYAHDLDKWLCLVDDTADIVVCLHVFEHLPRPEFTMSEVKRILRLGGILLAGSPIKPKIIAKLREKQFRREIASGLRKGTNHINAFWPKRWIDLAERQGLDIEFMSGSYLLRWTGFPLENYRWWLRLNQFLDALLPSLGMEFYLQARKTKKGICEER
jgi:SAM-dependent methyltransferase